MTQARVISPISAFEEGHDFKTDTDSRTGLGVHRKSVALPQAGSPQASSILQFAILSIKSRYMAC
jgi:hypothetical protein